MLIGFYVISSISNHYLSAVIYLFYFVMITMCFQKKTMTSMLRLLHRNTETKPSESPSAQWPAVYPEFVGMYPLNHETTSNNVKNSGWRIWRMMRAISSSTWRSRALHFYWPREWPWPYDKDYALWTRVLASPAVTYLWRNLFSETVFYAEENVE